MSERISWRSTARAECGRAALALASILPLLGANGDEARELVRSAGKPAFAVTGARLLPSDPTVAAVANGDTLDCRHMPVAGPVPATSAGAQIVTADDGSFRCEIATVCQRLTISVLANPWGVGRPAAGPAQFVAQPNTTSQIGSISTPAATNCQARWVSAFGAQPGSASGIADSLVFDDGGGPELYVAGAFVSIGTTPVTDVARWNGTRWAAVGDGINNGVNALAIFDDGSGPALYAAGGFTVASGAPVNHVAKWTGSTWLPLGGGIDSGVSDLVVFDDGSGSALYACGYFFHAGGNPVNNIAKWNGSAWLPVGNGLGGVAPDIVVAMTVYDDGSGRALYAGGNFTMSGTTSASRIAKWNGSIWSPLGSGVGGSVTATVKALAVFDDGNGPALYAGGGFSLAGGSAATNIAKWNGSTWSTVGSGLGGGVVYGLKVFDDGHGPALYSGGHFPVSGNHIEKWDGASWSTLGSGIGGDATTTVVSMTAFDDGHGASLHVSGTFQFAGGLGVANIAMWNGTGWSALDHGLSHPVDALTVFDDGHGPALYAGGDFTATSDGSAGKIAKWNGSFWANLGSGLTYPTATPYVYAILGFDSAVPVLYAGGSFNFAGGVPALNLAKWNGSSWSPLGPIGSGPDGNVYALKVFDDGTGPALYAGGSFYSASGVTLRGVGKWNGSSWSPLGSGLNVNETARALAEFDDGSGSALYVGGAFSMAGSVTTNNIAKWSGSSWFALGSGLPGSVLALAVFDDGGGPALYAGGLFSSAGGGPANHIAKWDGASWSALGSGTDGAVDALCTFDDGTGLALYAGGDFTTAGGVTAQHIAKWNGASWSGVGSGTSGPVLALTTYDDSSGPALITGGSFINAFDSGDSFLAKWGCPFLRTGTTYCTSSTTSSGCVPTISASGHASVAATTPFTISVNNVNGQRTGLIFYGVHGQTASPWGTGSSSLLCVKAPTQRMSLLSSGGTSGACDGLLAEDWNAFAALRPFALGQPFIRGETVWAQGWFRDPPAPKTSALSDGMVFAVGP